MRVAFSNRDQAWRRCAVATRAKNIQHTVKYTELAPVGSAISDARRPLQGHGKPAGESKSLASPFVPLSIRILRTGSMAGLFATIGLAHREGALDRLVLAR